MPTTLTFEANPGQGPCAGFELLGVLFSWHGKQAKLVPGVGAGKEELLARIDRLVEPFKHRQKREFTEYWDAMTYLQQGEVPKLIADSYEGGLLEDLIEMTGRGKLEDPTVAEFSQQQLFSHTQTQLRLVSAGSYRSQLIVPRVGPKPWPNAPLSPQVRRGIHQTIEVNMTGMGIGPDETDIEQLFMFAVSAQMHADLLEYYQTGFMRVRRCDHAACRSFFAAKRMDIRGRFCSTYCRVASNRSKAKPPARRRRTFID